MQQRARQRNAVATRRHQKPRNQSTRELKNNREVHTFEMSGVKSSKVTAQEGHSRYRSENTNGLHIAEKTSDQKHSANTINRHEYKGIRKLKPINRRKTNFTERLLGNLNRSTVALLSFRFRNRITLFYLYIKRLKTARSFFYF